MNPHSPYDDLDLTDQQYYLEHRDDFAYVPDEDEDPPPSPKQLSYLRRLADRAGQTFAYPRTAAQASREIRRLRAQTPSTRVERRIEHKQIADAIASGPGDSARFRDEEIHGWGSAATWANQPASPTRAPHTKPPAPAASAQRPTSRPPPSVSASSSRGTPSRQASAS
jgi:hypothetical protein